MSGHPQGSLALARSNVLSIDQLAAKRVDAMLGAMREEARLRQLAPNPTASSRPSSAGIPSRALSSSSRNSSCNSLSNLATSPYLSFRSSAPSPPALDLGRAIPDQEPIARRFSLSEDYHQYGHTSPTATSPKLRAPEAPRDDTAADSTTDLEDAVSGLVALRAFKRARH